MIRKTGISFLSCQESTIKSQTCLGRSLCVQSWVCKHKELPKHKVFHWSQGLEEKKDTGLLHILLGELLDLEGMLSLRGFCVEYYSSVSFTQVLIILMSPSVCSRRFFMGCIEVKVSSHTGCTWGRTGLKVWRSRLSLPYWLWEETEIIINICQGNCSDFTLHQHIMAWKKTALKGFLCSVSFAFWVG